MKFAIELPVEDAEGLTSLELRVLFRDAIHNFVDRREPAREYVRDGYSWMSAEEQEKKVAEVERRLRWARSLEASLASSDTQITDSRSAGNRGASAP